MAAWDPSKLNPLGGLFRPARAKPAAAAPQQRPEESARDEQLDVDDVFSIAPEEPTDPDQGRAPSRPEPDDEAKEQAGRKQAQQALRTAAKRPSRRPGMPAIQADALGGAQQAESMAQAQRASAGVSAEPRAQVLAALEQAKDPGVLFVEDADREGHSEDREDPALREAVEECLRRLFGVRGIHHIGPGRNEQGEPVIVIATKDGFTAASLEAVPDQVHGFRTLVALPFDLVPLRRTPSAR